MELKFKEVGKEYNVTYAHSKSLKIKPYLTIEEINDITLQMLNEDNQIGRHLVYICNLVKFCTNIDIKEDENGIINGSEVYDMLAKNNLLNFYKGINNYKTIDDIVAKTESVYEVASMLVKNIGETLDKFDMNKIQNGFVNLSNQLKEGKIDDK